MSRRPAHLTGIWRCLFCCLGLLAGPVARAAPFDLTNEWSLAGAAHSDTSPAIAQDGTTYFGTWDGELWAVSPDGKRKWIFRAGGEIKSSPAVGSDGTIYFGSRNRKLFAMRPEGKKQWEFPTGAWVDSSPALGQDGSI